jgi:hypothetical protein
LIPFCYYQFEVKILDPKIRETTFNSYVWKNEKSERYSMVQDILKTNKFIGENKKEVIKTLGNDFEYGPCNNCIGYSTFDPNISFGIDHDVIAIEFDSNNCVIETRLDMW